MGLLKFLRTLRCDFVAVQRNVSQAPKLREDPQAFVCDIRVMQIKILQFLEFD